jgi:hypothetical protein
MNQEHIDQIKQGHIDMPTSREILDALIAQGYEMCLLDRQNPDFTIIVNGRGEIDATNPNGPWTCYCRRSGRRSAESYTLNEVLVSVESLWMKENPKT